MKVFIKTTMAFLIGCFVLSSCKHGPLITKRHYNKGYYVSNSKFNKKRTKQNESMDQYGDQNKKFLYASADKKERTPSGHKTQVKNGTLKKEVPGNYVPANSKPFFHRVLSKSEDVNPAISINNKTSSKKMRSDKKDDDDEKLSWLGFLVILVVILWAIGFFIGGLGSLIHLLLVVALVLLILWLLKII